MKSFILTLLLVAISISTNLKADISIKNYKEFLRDLGEEKTLKMVNDYINGVGKGFFWANAYLEGTKRNRLFCNDGLMLNDRNYVDIMHKEYMAGNYDDNMYIELVLLFGLQKTFPCR